MNIKYRFNIVFKNVLIVKINVLYNNICNNIIKFDMVILWKLYICFNFVFLMCFDGIFYIVNKIL